MDTVWTGIASHRESDCKPQGHLYEQSSIVQGHSVLSLSPYPSPPLSLSSSMTQAIMYTGHTAQCKLHLLHTAAEYFTPQLQMNSLMEAEETHYY